MQSSGTDQSRLPEQEEAEAHSCRDRDGVAVQGGNSEEFSVRELVDEVASFWGL